MRIATLRPCFVAALVLGGCATPTPEKTGTETTSESLRTHGASTDKLNDAVAAVRGGDCDRLSQVSDYAGQYIDASYQLAMLFADGVCVEKDVARAIELSNWNCDRHGDLESCHFLGLQFLDERNKDNQRAALALIRFGAYHGHFASMVSLAWMYTQENGPAFDVDAAVYWYHKAALSGLHEPMFSLFYIYSATGPRQSREKAKSWLERAAGAGSPAAYATLAKYYEDGVMYPRDRKKAKLWREKFRATGAKIRWTPVPGTH